LAAGRGHAHAGPPDRLPHADGDLAVHGVALTLEERMLAHSGADHEIAARPPERRGAALARNAHLASRLHPGGDRHGHGVDASVNPAPPAPRAGRPLGVVTARVADGARREALDVKAQPRASCRVRKRELDREMNVVAAPAGIDGAGDDLVAEA